MSTLSYNEILIMFQEIGRRFEESERSAERSSQETDRKFQEIGRRLEASSQETDRKFQEIGRRLEASSQETDRKFQEIGRRLEASSQETDRKFQETDKRFKETERLVNKVSKDIGNLGNRLGQFVQEMVRPAVVRLFRARGINVRVVYQNIEAELNGDEIEIDLMVVNDNEAIAVECKSNLSIDDINDHLERLGKIKTILPIYQNYQVMGAVAAMVIPQDAARYAYRKGLYVLTQNGEAIDIRNDDKFIPKVW